MVKEDDLDEMILEIFEEQEEQFYYPITSQNTARNFVKALNGKGVSYELVYKEIGEFEHNFSAWRKGLGRIGIGNRMIERINKPLQDVLLSDDEDELTEILAKLSKEKIDKETRPTNDRVPPIPKTQPTKDEDRASKLLENMQREKVDEALKSADVNGEDSLKTGPRLLPGAQLATKEPGVVDFRSVLKNRTSPEDGRISIEVPSQPKHTDTKTSKKPTGNKASSEPAKKEKNTQNEVDKAKLKRDNLGLNLKQKDTKTDKVDGLAKKSDTDKELEKLADNLGNEPLPPAAHVKKPAPLAGAETSESSSEEESESESESKENGKTEESESEEESEESEEEEEEEEEDLPDIDENYDSDLDFDNVDLRQGKKLAEDVLKYKIKVCDREGPGFLYVFTDSPQDDPKPRFKVYSSKFPRKRLAQARCFNVDIRMVVCFEVNLRKRALKRTQERLFKYDIEKRPHWYQAPRDEMIETVTSIASKYPATESLC